MGPDAFTLVELVVVLAVLAILAAAAAPAVAPAPAEKRAARELAAVLDRARRQAAMTGRVVYVRMDADTVTTSRADSGPAAYGSGDRARLSAIPTTVSPAGLPFRFHPMGDGAGPVVRFAGAAGEGWRVRLEPWTGRPRVEAG